MKWEMLRSTEISVKVERWRHCSCLCKLQSLQMPPRKNSTGNPPAQTEAKSSQLPVSRVTLPSTGHPEVRGRAAKGSSQHLPHSSTPGLKPAFVCLWLSIFIFFANLWLTPGESSSKRTNWEDLLQREMLARNPICLFQDIYSITTYLFNILKCVAYHWISVPEASFDNMWYLGLRVGEKCAAKKKKKCPSLIWWGEEVRAFTTSCWRREFSLSDGAE